MTRTRYSVVIFGCGNCIMGDDGFGPAVIEELSTHHILPEYSTAIDAGTGIREYLFDFLLSPEGRPDRILVLDAVDQAGRAPGEIFTLSPSLIPTQKIHDFSLHQFPTVNLLQEIEEHTDIAVDVLVAQIESIPDEIQPGLSASMKDAVPVACEKILQMVSAPN